MHVDLSLPSVLPDALEAAREADALPYATGWIPETGADPFVSAAVALHGTSRLQVGTGIAVAFARSPFVVAQTAWNLARTSQGRFVLGLGTQVRAHVERRFSGSWHQPAPQLRDYVLAVRAIWRAFQGERPDYHGRYYEHSLLSAYFTPPANDHPDIPIYLAAVNPLMAAVAGEVADGLHAHPLSSPQYLRTVIEPAIRRGAERGGRGRADVELLVPIWVATGRTADEAAAARESIRARIGFYGATRSYRAVFEAHGWDDVPERLNRALKAGDQDALRRSVSEEILETFAVCEPPSTVASVITERFGGLAQRVMIYDPLPSGLTGFWPPAGRGR